MWLKLEAVEEEPEPVEGEIVKKHSGKRNVEEGSNARAVQSHPTFQPPPESQWQLTRPSFATNYPRFVVSLLLSTTDMSFLPPPPPGMPGLPPGMPPPPPGMPSVAPGDPSSSRLPPEVLTIKSQKWIQMQKKRYGQKRKGGYVDMGKQVSYITSMLSLRASLGWVLYRTCLLNMCAKL